MSSAAVQANRAFGLDRGLPFPLSDIAEASVVVLVGSNPADTMPRRRCTSTPDASGARHVVVDPRRTATARNAALHLQPPPGTDLALAKGLPGRPGSGWETITGQGNGQGGREHGQKADQLPGYRSLTDPAARPHVAAVWGVDPDDLPMPGKSAFELLDALGTEGVRTLLVLASNVAVSAPDARRVISRLRDLDFLAVSDFFLSETAELADVVLPSAMWAEEDGTMTHVEGRVLRRRKALDPQTGVPDDLRLLARLAARLGTGDTVSGDAETVFEELRRASAGGGADYSGISYRRIDDEQGVFWPCRAPDHPGTPRLFAERFATPDGRARFLRVGHVDAHERPDADYPYVLTTGRVLAQYQSGTQTRRTWSLQLVAPAPRAELYPDLARRLGISADDVVELATRRGRARFLAHVTDAIRPDVVFAPFHWGGGSSANALTDPALDPVSKMPELPSARCPN